MFAKDSITEEMKIKEDLSSVQKEIIESFKQNKEVYEKIQLLGLKVSDVKKNLTSLITYYDDAVICQNCPGMKNCPKEHSCYEIGLTFDGKFVGITNNPCKKAAEILKYDSLFMYRDFDKDHLGKTLKDVDKTNVRKPILAQMVKLIKNQSREWLYLRGDLNSGRTFMMSCFATDFALNNSAPVAYCNTPTLVEELKTLSIKDKKMFDTKMNNLISLPLVVLDGIGNEYMSDFSFAQIILPILSKRLSAGLLTCFTSDFTIEEIVDMYSSKIGKPKARQLASIFASATSKEHVLDGIKLY